MTWHPEGWEAPATLQLSLSEPRPGACAIQAHLEKLPDPDAREASRERWRGVLDRIAAVVERDPRVEVIRVRSTAETIDADPLDLP
jgi:hypothetical protein